MDIQVRFPNGKAKAVTLSYDDGVTTDVRMIETLAKYGIKSTFNLNSGLFPQIDETEGHARLCGESCKALYIPNGHEVASHCYGHPHIGAIDTAIAINDMVHDRSLLEKMTGCTVRGFAYPYNSFNDTIVDAVRLCGYSYARVTDTDESFRLPSDWLVWKPTSYHRNPRLFELCDRFLSGQPMDIHAPWLFCMWGHSSDFQRDDNWDILDNFCNRMGGHSDIWYATNIEICDYVNAYRQLRFSVDATFVENPTNTQLWFVKDHRIYQADPGERVFFEEDVK